VLWNQNLLPVDAQNLVGSLKNLYSLWHSVCLIQTSHSCPIYTTHLPSMVFLYHLQCLPSSCFQISRVCATVFYQIYVQSTFPAFKILPHVVFSAGSRGRSKSSSKNLNTFLLTSLRNLFRQALLAALDHKMRPIPRQETLILDHVMEQIDNGLIITDRVQKLQHLEI
jgi:hypothetical protein